jgi:acyl-coenzyme A synthetase/AMP-(fatty) acid ligase
MRQLAENINFYDDIDVFGQATAIISENSDHFTYAELVKSADALKSQFRKRTLVLSMCENSLESVVGYIGFLRGRIVQALVNSSINREMFDNLLRKYKPEYIWLQSEKAKDANWGTEVYRYGNYVLLKTEYVIDYTLHEDIALLLTTSGSTGSPMLVRQSYKNINDNASAIAQYLGITQTDRPITTLPVSYTYGLSIINSHLLKGCAIILTGKTFMEKAFWEQLRTYGATTFGGVPYSYEILKKLRFSRMELPSLKCLTQAGGKLSPDLALEFATICEQKGIRFFAMYGQTEATARMSYLPSEYSISKASSIGIAIPGGELWLEDDNGNVITDSDTAGELVYKGNNVTMGYAVSCRDLCKGDENGGVLKTGDIAKRDADGFFYIVGRKKRFLKLFGNRVNLDEVEQLAKVSGYNCVCSGVDDHLRIYTSAKENHAKIKSLVAERTGIHMSACEVIYIENIPRNETGKIIYSALK